MSDSSYLDASVVVAYYVPEPNSVRVQRLFEMLDAPVTSELVDLEFVSALSLRNRIGDLETAQAQEIVRLYEDHVEAGLYTRLTLRADHYRWVREVIARFDLPLMAPDALHLAAARFGGHRLVTADRQLARNGEALGIPVDLIEP